MPIDSIQIQGVRGIRREVPLALGGDSLVMCGDNGTGKSSIVAGLRWALRGEHEPDSTARPGTEDAYRAHVLDGVATAQVIVTLKGEESITVKPGSFDAGDAGKALRAACQRSTPFLLRKHLLKFLEDKPVDRFRYLEGFLDLGQADDVREAFAGRSRVHESSAADHRRTRDSHLAGIVSFMPPGCVTSPVSWAAVVSGLGRWATTVHAAPAGASWEDLLGLLPRLRTLVEGEGLARRRMSLGEAVERWRVVASTPVPDDPAALLVRLGALTEGVTDAALSALLEAARRHFVEHADADACPVCRQGINASDVAGEIQRRLAALDELHDVRHKLSSCGLAWKTYFASLDTAVALYERALPGGGLPPRPAGAERLLANLDGSSWAEQVSVIGASTLLDWAVPVRERALSTLENELASLPSEDDTEGLRRLVDALERAEKVRLAVEVAEAGAEDAAARAQGFKVIAEALRMARQDVATELLDEISGLVAEFYGHVHPPDSDEEVTGAPEIQVQRRSGGTAHVRGTFHAKAIDDPRWVYSDGHLDTVGICVFLALRRFRAERDKARDHKLMVLDDIVLSVDLGHGRRLLDLLSKRFDDHQVLIFTHNRLFADWCSELLPKYRRKAIARWTLESGPQIGEYLSALEYIEQAILSATSPKLLAQAVMNLMDEWLAQARFEYAVSVPARRGDEYTLTEIWNPFAKRLRDIERKMGTPLGRLGPLLDELVNLPQMRNRLAAHENEFAREFPLSVVREYANRVVELVRLLYCAACTKFAIPVPNHENPEIFRCKPNCEKIRVVRPSRQA